MASEPIASPNKKRHPVDQVLPLPDTALFALQHVIVFYGSGILLPVVVGRSIGMPAKDIVYLISADLFTCGIATLIQSVGFWKFGARLPVVEGLAIFGIPVIIATGKQYGLPVVYGSVLITGVLSTLAAPYAKVFLRFFPPIVIGLILTAIGIGLINLSLNQMAGGVPSAPNFGSPLLLGLSFGTLLIIVVLYWIGNGILRSASLLIAMAIATIVAALIGEANFSKVSSVGVFEVVTPFHFGLPQFSLIPTLLMIIVGIVAMVETISGITAVEELVERKLTNEMLDNGLRASGLATIIGGIFNCFPYAVYLGNVAVLGLTNVWSRWVVAGAGALMVFLSLFPKFSAFFETIPTPVIGGAGLVMFGLITLAGMRMICASTFHNNNNGVVVALTLGVGLIPVLTPTLFTKLPSQLTIITSNTILLTAIVAIGLNALLNGVTGPLVEQHEVPPLA